MNVVWLAYAELGLASVVFAGGQAAAKLALHRIPIAEFLWWRAWAGLAGCALIARSASLQQISPVTGLLLAASLALVPILINVLHFTGITRGQLGVQNALRQTTPIWLVAVQVGLFSAPLSSSDLSASLLVIFATVALAGPRFPLSSLGLGLGAAVCQAGGLLLQERLLHAINAPTLLLLQNVSLLFVTALWRFTTKKPSTGIDRRAVLLAMASGLLVQFGYDGLRYLALPQVGARVVAYMGLLNLPLTLLAGWWFFREQLRLRLVVGVAALLAGTALSLRSP